MTIPTRNCNACKYQLLIKEQGRMVCLNGHKPRFYHPREFYPVDDTSWGYKRRCKDFQPSTMKKITP
jgi:hypothetical protein